MDSRAFESEILRLAYETEFRITVPAVAYYFSMPSREARQHLDRLIDDGVLELDSDRNGNLFYRLPENAGGYVQQKVEKLIAPSFSFDEESASDSESVSVAEPEMEPAPTGVRYYTADFEEISGSSATASKATTDASINGPTGDRGEVQVETRQVGATYHQPAAQQLTQPAAPQASIHYADHEGEHKVSYIVPPAHANQSASVTSHGGHSASAHNSLPPFSYRPEASQEAFSPVHRSSQQIAFDAELGSSHTSKYVIQTEVTCDPSYVSEGTPRSTSAATCNEPIVKGNNQLVTSAQTSYPVPYNRYQEEDQRDALAPTHFGQNLYAEDWPASQADEDHSPLAAGLLSLCIPGAGQFYNGEIGKGFLFMLLTFISWLGFFGWVVHLISVIDAVSNASRIKNGTQDKQLPDFTNNQKLLPPAHNPHY